MVTVLYITHEFDKAYGSTKSLLNMIDSLNGIIRPIVLFPKEGSVEKMFRKRGIKTIVSDFPVSYIEKGSIKQYLYWIPKIIRQNYKFHKSFNNVKRILIENEVRCIHTNTGVIEFGYYLSKRLGLPHVWHVREFFDLDFNLRPLMGFSRFHRLLSLSNASIFITKAVMNHHISKNDSHSFQIYNAIVKRKSKDLIIWDKEKYFLFTGRVAKGKGLETAIEAFASFNDSVKGYHLVVAGDIEDSYYQEILQLTDKFGITDKIKFVGYVENLTDLYRKASAFLMCSENEALGRVTVEAMSNGCVVIGKDSGGTSEIIQNNITGYLFQTASECSSLMKKVLHSNNQQMINEAFDYANDQFSEENYSSKIINIYKQIIR